MTGKHLVHIPVNIIRQGGEPVFIGEATVDSNGDISGHLEPTSLEAIAEETLGSMSFAISLPKKFLLGLTKSMHPHGHGKHEKHEEGT